MKFKTIALTAGVALIGLVLVCLPSYNGLVNSEENVDKGFGIVQTELKRQFDSVNTTAQTVNSQANFEQDTFKGVAEARSKAGGALQSVTGMSSKQLSEDPKASEKIAEAQNSIGNVVGRLMSIQEAYPNLKSGSAFKDLRRTIDNSANRVNAALRDTETLVTDYNKQVRQIPGKIPALLFGFRAKPHFDAGAGKQEMPDVTNRR